MNQPYNPQMMPQQPMPQQPMPQQPQNPGMMPQQPAAAQQQQPQMYQQPMQQMPQQYAIVPLPAIRAEWTISRGKEGEQIALTTPPFRLSWPDLQETAKYQNQDTGKYGLEGIFEPHTDVSVLQDAIEYVGQKKWGPDWRSKVKGHGMRPARVKAMDRKTGETREIYNHDGWIIRPKTKRKPPVLKRPQGQNRLMVEAAPDDVYSGCYCVCSVNVFPYTGGDMGVTLQLKSVMKFDDGDPIGGGGAGNPAADFADIPAEEVGDVNAGFMQPQMPPQGQMPPQTAPQSPDPAMMPPAQPQQPYMPPAAPGMAPGPGQAPAQQPPAPQPPAGYPQ